MGYYFLTILIIITPGSTVIRISKNTNKFFIHSIDVSEKDKENLLKSIKQYEDLILEHTMIEMFTQIFIISALVIFGMALLVCLVRLIKGPTTADRVVSFDASSAVVMSIVGVMSVIFNSVSYLDSIMLIAIISFVSSVSISRFIGEGRVFNGNHKRHR